MDILATHQSTHIGVVDIDIELCNVIFKKLLDSQDRLVQGRNLGKYSYKFEYDKNIKDSLEIELSDLVSPDLAKKYVDELRIALEKYIQAYPYTSNIKYYTDGINVQLYPPGGGFKVWHYERDPGTRISKDRILTYMTYLNDVDEQGETEFYFQDVKIKPVVGRTVIWPAEFTHLHRGIPSNQVKAILTGWILAR